MCFEGRKPFDSLKWLHLGIIIVLKITEVFPISVGLVVWLKISNFGILYEVIVWPRFGGIIHYFYLLLQILSL